VEENLTIVGLPDEVMHKKIVGRNEEIAMGILKNDMRQSDRNHRTGHAVKFDMVAHLEELL